jgi:hypothetical protein
MPIGRGDDDFVVSLGVEVVARANGLAVVASS